MFKLSTIKEIFELLVNRKKFYMFPIIILLIALIGVSAAHVTGNSIFDGASSVLIGLLLMISGVFLGYEMKHLIVGESVDKETKNRIYNLIDSNESIKEVSNLDVVIIGSNKYLVVGDIDYLDDLDDETIGNTNNQIIEDLKKEETYVMHVFLNTV